jgi:hypothetical protein
MLTSQRSAGTIGLANRFFGNSQDSLMRVAWPPGRALGAGKAGHERIELARPYRVGVDAAALAICAE